jgi:hypothetical protein
MSGLLDEILLAHGGLNNGGNSAERKRPSSPGEGCGPSRANLKIRSRVAIEKVDGTVVSERRQPRQSFDGHEFATPWDPLQRAYFKRLCDVDRPDHAG